jgi:hypothetical protein
MRVRRTGLTKRARLLRTRVLWLGVLAGIFAMVFVARPGEREGFAQSTMQQASAIAVPGTDAEALKPAKPSKQEALDAAALERKKRIADDSANLLKLANSLKADVDKTTKDMLSVTVVREAGEIEQLAHKMRSK